MSKSFLSLLIAVFISFPAYASPNTSLSISPEQATAIALNSFKLSSDSIKIKHPSHIAEFKNSGMSITPKAGGPVWRWQLDSVASLSGEALKFKQASPRKDAQTVKYDRGLFSEQYVCLLYTSPSPRDS